MAHHPKIALIIPVTALSVVLLPLLDSDDLGAPNGAQLRYTTSDPALVAALRDWFAAQVSDHGEHAAPPSQPLQPTPSGDDLSTSGGDQHSQHHRP